MTHFKNKEKTTKSRLKLWSKNMILNPKTPSLNKTQRSSNSMMCRSNLTLKSMKFKSCKNKSILLRLFRKRCMKSLSMSINELWKLLVRSIVRKLKLIGRSMNKRSRWSKIAMRNQANLPWKIPKLCLRVKSRHWESNIRLRSKKMNTHMSKHVKILRISSKTN